METPNPKDNFLVGFLSLIETEAKDGYLGAILVTDAQGIPQEFRCTHPVKPTTVQRSLYGDTLLPHIGINLCGIPLIKVIQTKPALILVRYASFLPIRSASLCPVAVVQRAGTTIEVHTPTDQSPLIRIRLESPIARFQPVVIETSKAESQTVQALLQTKFAGLDPLEPFERIISAVQLLNKYDKRFQ